MAGKSSIMGWPENKVDTGISLDAATVKKDSGTTVKKKQRGVLSRIWNVLFRRHGDDYEKKLQNISKKEDIIVARMKKRSQNWRSMARNLIIFSVIFEFFTQIHGGKQRIELLREENENLWLDYITLCNADRNDLYSFYNMGYAIVITRSVDLDWKMRALRVLPMFLLPALFSLVYSGFANFFRMFDRKDQQTLEKLRAERQANIDELKEKRNYYMMQQLIQKYDTDPAAKAAAAAVLASKLQVGDESNLRGPTGKSNNSEPGLSSGLRSRKQLHTKPTGAGSTVNEQMFENSEITDPNSSVHKSPLVVGHHQPGSNTNGGGWIARCAALLVGKDPTQSYALICGNCHMHNGLARKEDFPYITYYCPHCNALNKSQKIDGSQTSDINSASSPSTTPTINNSARVDSGTNSETLSSTSNPSLKNKGNETSLLGDLKPVS